MMQLGRRCFHKAVYLLSLLTWLGPHTIEWPTYLPGRVCNRLLTGFRV